MILGSGKANAAQVWFIDCTNQVDRGRTFAVDPFAVGGEKGPDAVELEAAIRSNARLRNADGIQRLDWVQTNAGKMGTLIELGHTQSLAESRGALPGRTTNLQFAYGVAAAALAAALTGL